MWFKMGMDIWNSNVMRELNAPSKAHDTGSIFRKMAFIYLLSITATGGAQDLQDAAHLARIIDTTPRQAQIVWDVCIKHGVLRQGPQGYSARPWMIERGILGDFERKHRKAEPKGPSGPQTQQPSQTGYRTDGGKNSW